MENHSIVPRIFDFLPGDQHLYAAGINREWRDGFRARNAQPRTSYVAASATPERAAVAIASVADANPAVRASVINRIAISAARHGRLETLKWMKRNTPMPPMNEVEVREMSKAVVDGGPAVIAWCFKRGGYELERSGMCERAAARGNLPSLRILRRLGVEWGGAVYEAARNGHLQVLEWALWHNAFTDSALDLDILFYMVVEAVGAAAAITWGLGQRLFVTWPGPLHKDTACATAATEGHLEALRILRARNYPWDSRVTTTAAFNGYLELLQWAYNNGCPINFGECRENAEVNEQLHVVIWLDSL